MWEEEVQKNTELWDGLDDEIYTAPSLERLREIPMFSPQRAFTGWCADQVLSPPLDLIGDQCEWASFLMYSPQRSSTGWCADQEQSPEDEMHSNFVTIGNSVTFGNSVIGGIVSIGNSIMVNLSGKMVLNTTLFIKFHRALMLSVKFNLAFSTRIMKYQHLYSGPSQGWFGPSKRKSNSSCCMAHVFMFF